MQKAPPPQAMRNKMIRNRIFIARSAIPSRRHGDFSRQVKPMNPQPLISSLQLFPKLLNSALEGVSENDVRWRPPDNAWSILEIVAHLADEEELDFKVRLRSTLEDAMKKWPGIDPPGWAVEKKYNSWDLRETLDRFTAERARSVEWLRSLDKPDWNQTHEHPKIGAIRAGDLLAAWAAHDHFHLRQITKRRIQLIDRDAQPFSIQYAGGTL